MTTAERRLATCAAGAAFLGLLLALRPVDAAAGDLRGEPAAAQAAAAAQPGGGQAQTQQAPATGHPGGDHAQAPPAAAPALRLQPLTGSPVDLTANDLQRLPRQTVRVTYPAAAGPDHQATSQEELSGFPLRAVLDRLGLPSGHDVHGDALRLYVVAEGADGYRAVLALAELDASFTDNVVLVADRRAGQPLSANEGPLRLIVPTDKRPARWVRQLVRIYVGKAP